MNAGMVFRTHGRALALLLLALACRHAERPSDAAPGVGNLPSSPKDPFDPSGSKLSPGAVLGERNRCIDRELARRDLNEFGDPPGTQYADSRPLGVTAGMGRYEYVLQNHPEIHTTCSAAPGEPTR